MLETEMSFNNANFGGCLQGRQHNGCVPTELSSVWQDVENYLFLDAVANEMLLAAGAAAAASTNSQPPALMPIPEASLVTPTEPAQPSAFDYDDLLDLDFILDNLQPDLSMYADDVGDFRRLDLPDDLIDCKQEFPLNVNAFPIDSSCADIKPFVSAADVDCDIAGFDGLFHVPVEGSTCSSGRTGSVYSDSCSDGCGSSVFSPTTTCSDVASPFPVSPYFQHAPVSTSGWGFAVQGALSPPPSPPEEVSDGSAYIEALAHSHQQLRTPFYHNQPSPMSSPASYGVPSPPCSPYDQLRAFERASLAAVDFFPPEAEMLNEVGRFLPSSGWHTGGAVANRVRSSFRRCTSVRSTAVRRCTTRVRT